MTISKAKMTAILVGLSFIMFLIGLIVGLSINNHNKNLNPEKGVVVKKKIEPPKDILPVELDGVLIAGVNCALDSRTPTESYWVQNGLRMDVVKRSIEKLFDNWPGMDLDEHKKWMEKRNVLVKRLFKSDTNQNVNIDFLRNINNQRFFIIFIGDHHVTIQECLPYFDCDFPDGYSH